MYRAHRGPVGSLTPLVGYSGGQRITSLHQQLLDDALDVRTAADTDVVYAQLDATTAYGGDWGEMHPVATSARRRVQFIRFVLPDIPQGAIITACTLSLAGAQNQSVATPADDLRLGFEQADTVASPANLTAVQNRWENVGATVTWQNSGTWNNNVARTSPNLASALQQVIDRAGWAPGNAVGVWTYHPGNGANALQLRAHNGVAEANRPRLQVEYQHWGTP